MTLNEREAFWAEQLPIFKENYICLAQFEAVQFNSETGNFDALTADATGFDLDDILEAYHSVNTGWAMWLRAKSLEKAKAQAVPEGYVLMPLEPTQEMLGAASLAPMPMVHIDSISGIEKLRISTQYKAMVKVCESGAEG